MSTLENSESNQIAIPKAPAKNRKRRRFTGKHYSRFMKLVRRTHMYTGLILLPWVLLFGASGVLFNHPTWLASAKIVHRSNPEIVKKTVGFAPPDPASFAAQVVACINNGIDGDELPKFELVSPDKAWLTGSLSYTAATEAGQHTIWLNLHNGSARIKIRPKSNEELIERPSFAGSKVDVKIPGLDGAERKLLKLLEQANINPSEEVKLRSRPSPQLLFQVRGRDGQLWNATCNLLNGRLDGRATEMGARLDLRSAITRLHQLHHYPDNLGARWLWTLAADATGLMLVFWGISGVIMWWQIKPTRLVGVSGLSIAAVIAFLVISSTLTELGFGPPRSSRGASVERSGRNNQRSMILDGKSVSTNALGELPAEGF